MQQILKQANAQGYDIDSPLKQWEINKIFDASISTGVIERQFPRQVIQQIWLMTQKNQDNQVILGQFLQNMEKKNKLQYLPTKKDDSPIINNRNTEQSQQIEVQVEQYDDGSMRYSNNNTSSINIEQNINATINESMAPNTSLITNQSNKKPFPQKQPNKKLPSDSQQLRKPLIYHQREPTQQQIQDQLIKNIPRPKLKSSTIISQKTTSKKNDKQSTKLGSSLRTDQISKSLHKQSVSSRDQILGKSVIGVQQQPNQKDKKCINKKWIFPMCMFIFGLVIFMSSFIINSQLKRLAIEQVILSPQNENIWAHFPGDTKAEIDRNWTFFNITNADNMLFYSQKPKFRQIKGYKIVQLEDYLNITYIDDGDRVQMVDWLHFEQQSETRNLDEKVKILNVGGLAYWYNIKVARPTIILQQGLGLLFSTLQSSILPNIYAQAINMQFLPQFNDDIYSTIFAPAQIPFKEALFIWQDPAYGLGSQDNLKYWLEAIPSDDQEKNQTVGEGFLFLKKYFTLRSEQLSFIIQQIKSYVQFTQSAVLENNYCQNTPSCTGRYLAYQQFSSSFVTRNPPPGKDVPPTDTICMSNSTCEGYFPEISAFYQNVYLERFPDKNSTLSFDPEWMKNVVDYNRSIEKGYDYNTAEDCLFHIGNLDALWDNGTLYEASLKEDFETQNNQQNTETFENKYLKNIQQRFKLPSPLHAQVFWHWIKYLNNEVILRNQTNQKLGVANLFSTGLYSAFSYLQDNLQFNLLVDLIHHDITTSGTSGDCSYFIEQSFELGQHRKALDICNKYGQKIQKQLIKDLLEICDNQYRETWWLWKNTYQLSSLNLLSLCDPQQENEQIFGVLLHERRKYLNDKYECNITPKEYCSDYELAAIQWSSSRVTLNPPEQLSFNNNYTQSFTYNQWNNKARRFQYGYYKSKYPNNTQQFPQISIQQAYQWLNFDNWFSASVMLKQFVNQQFDDKFKDYMRFVGIEVGLNGLTIERSPRELIFGYEDDILKQIKESYPPFGGDPSTPSLIAFNDPNITKQQATMTLEWSTGKYNSSLVGQYRKINGRQYLTIEKDFFNGNITTKNLISPWQGEDYVYGTSAKQFAPNQFDQPNISLYVPNIQRYGSGVIDTDSTEQRFGFDLQVGYLGEYIYESTSQSDINKKYYQNFHAIFNQTSVVGFPLYVCKNHFMNVTANWSTLVQIWDENETVMYQQASQYDDSFVIVEPYTGVSFQSTVYLQSNYYHSPDSLLNFYQQSLLPIFALARSGNITEQVANNLLGPLKIGITVVKWTKIIGVVIIVIASIICGVIYYKKKKQDQKSGLLMDQDEEGERSDVDEEDHSNKKNTQTRVKRQLKNSQLGISLQPITSPQQPSNNTSKPSQPYTPPPVTEEQI